jgi:4-amino-4-deoxychorismate lyase
MSPLFESIACLDGQLQNLSFHQTRMNRSRAMVLKHSESINLNLEIPQEAKEGLWKCRVAYGNKIDKVDFSKYIPAHAKTFKLVKAEIAYPHKFEDRQALNALFELRGIADDIIIVVDDLVTDTSYGNLIFSDGQNWVTPRQPLLEGTMRASLLATGQISVREVTVNDLEQFSRFMMINALNPFDEQRALSIENIIL